MEKGLKSLNVPSISKKGLNSKPKYKQNHSKSKQLTVGFTRPAALQCAVLLNVPHNSAATLEIEPR
jgi:hypothetical protein